MLRQAIAKRKFATNPFNKVKREITIGSEKLSYYNLPALGDSRLGKLKLHWYKPCLTLILYLCRNTTILN